MSQEPFGSNRITLLRSQLRTHTTQSGYRAAALNAGPRAREKVPAIDLMHEPPAYAITTLIGLLERDRLGAPILLIERGLDDSGTPFVHHENATAALGAACTALHPCLRGGSASDLSPLLDELIGMWMVAGAVARNSEEDRILRDLARGMGPWMVPQGWGSRLLHASASTGGPKDSLVLTLMQEAIRERAPGLRLRVVRHALEALDTNPDDQFHKFWRRAVAFVVGAAIFEDPFGRLPAEYNAHRDSPASRHRRAVDFIYKEAIPTYQSVRD
ncbi:hypothetical protein [Halorhodospira halochloris]|uniref:hypothetical protein n=1 Tax=Halorhodospira halochloris TaxID=1052 RepID=UPI00076F7C01|nr:hypothetical protein [Halorhodospira halochloris]MBK1650646.1 hypothetical protein [Halorhodospira halochloris]